MAPSEVKIWGFGGRNFCFDNRPDRVERKWMKEEKRSLLSRGGAMSVGFGVFGVGFGVFGRASYFDC